MTLADINRYMCGLVGESHDGYLLAALLYNEKKEPKKSEQCMICMGA